MNKTVDFSQARFKHLNWKFKIRNFLDGKEVLTEEQAISHDYCDLGIWYNTDGRFKYGKIPCMKKFETEHERLHNAVKKIQQLKSQGKTEEAEALFIELVDASDTIVELLNEAESIINQ
jgi:methyl-accepting chemotaxis protein